jgi:hypothetical protein
MAGLVEKQTGLTAIPIDSLLLFKCFATNSFSVKRNLAKH